MTVFASKQNENDDGATVIKVRAMSSMCRLYNAIAMRDEAALHNDYTLSFNYFLLNQPQCLVTESSRLCEQELQSYYIVGVVSGDYYTTKESVGVSHMSKIATAAKA